MTNIREQHRVHKYIDNILINLRQYNYEGSIINSNISDHLMQKPVIELVVNEKNCKVSGYFSTENINLFLNKLLNLNWEILCNISYLNSMNSGPRLWPPLRMFLKTASQKSSKE